ncbi:MAG TPA: LptF/LptG family permease [Blastocatellia bacterium]|nr:LptF/LptG family permease [Blastocatellia bacterium]
MLDSLEMLRLIDRYLLREVVPYVALGFVLLTAIIFLQQSTRFSELLVVYSRNGLPMEGLWRILSALLPDIAVVTLPISLLIGCLVGMGRLSGDSEIVALGASGISRLQILRPILALALVAGGAMLYLKFNVLPRSIHNLKDLKANHGVLFQGLKAQIKPRVFDESIPHKVLYVEETDRATNRWHNIFLVDLASDAEEPKLLTASSGYLREGENSESLELVLEHSSIHELSERSSEASQSSTSNAAGQVAQPGAAQERKKNHNQNSGAPRSQQNYTVSSSEATVIGLAASQEKEVEDLGLNTDQLTVAELPWNDLIKYTPAPNGYRAWLAEVHERIAFPAACLVFAVLAVAFGISNVRTGRSFGLLLGLAITIAYYLLALSGKHAAVAGKLPVWLGVWQANILLGAGGLFVLWMQRRPGADVLSALTSLRHRFRSKPVEEIGVPATAASGLAESASAMPRSHRGLGAVTSIFPKSWFGARSATVKARPGPRRRIHGYQLIDRLVLSDLSRFFFYILGGFSALFLIITLFQLLDAITRNNIEFTIVANYLLFLLPMTVNYMAPIAALIAVMVTFGLLEKTSQVVVLKASGISIYRLAGPALICAALLSSAVFINQDYVLPFTNRRQDNLYHLIRSGQEPAQTFYQADHKWIFGGESRLYNYDHFNQMDNVFARLTILNLSRDPFAISSRIFANRAKWDGSTDTWVLQDGWERHFKGDQREFEAFAEKRISLPEHPEYFKRDTRESSMMTLAELRQHINNLSRSGFDVLDLRIDLYKKIAFPATCIVMMLVGLPFAFSVGKKGALYGVTIGIIIGLAYSGLLELFLQMGRYEVLPPLLAAWGPNMMFGLGGLYLFLTSRT